MEQISNTDGNMQSLNIGDNIHEPIINLDSNVAVSLPATAVVSLEEAPILFNKYKEVTLPDLSEEEEEKEEPEEPDEHI